jgi:hypothetical protein
MQGVKRAGWLTAAAGVLALASATPVASAEPAPVYQFAACYDPGQPVQEKPPTVVYGCDHTSVMENMTWTAWGAEAVGTGVDNAIECKPNCAQGPRLLNPIIVRAWNPAAPETPGCPAGVEFYRDFTVAYPEGVPPWVQPGTSWTEDVAFIDLDGMPAVHFSNQTPFSCAVR